MLPPSNDTDPSLILAAEDCPPELFPQYHRFSPADNKIIDKLVAHGPVLLQGSRGSGKSALMIEASRRTAPETPDAPVVGIYLSLRHAPLIRSTGADYERLLCSLIIRGLTDVARGSGIDFEFQSPLEIGSVRDSISDFVRVSAKKVVLLFDDVAHLGREASLGEFFDAFRTLSSNYVSCKAAIYPGVTNFGTRFDVYNDATVINITRSDEQDGFGDFFHEVARARAPDILSIRYAQPLSQMTAPGFIGQSVLGNMRAFVFACTQLAESTKTVGLTEIKQRLGALGTEYYWPLLEEVRPKLGKYAPLVETAQEIAEVIVRECSERPGCRSALIHKNVTARFAKVFEILEYAGFIARREASRAMKSGGRGARFAISTCILLEHTRLTREIFEMWTDHTGPAVEFHEKGSQFTNITVPPLKEAEELAIFREPLAKLQKSAAYPYGLTDLKISVLLRAGFNTIGDLASASDGELDRLQGIGEATVRRIRNVLGQAIWM